MRNLLLTISYCGKNLHGWQIQDNAVTVQEVFQVIDIPLKQRLVKAVFSVQHLQLRRRQPVLIVIGRAGQGVHQKERRTGDDEQRQRHIKQSFSDVFAPSFHLLHLRVDI